MNKYRKEKFKDRNEALIWVADNKPIYYPNGEFCNTSIARTLGSINSNWESWCKAIEIVEEKRLVEVWVNVYPEKSVMYSYESKEDAIEDIAWECIGTVKLSKEITIIDGKVVENGK